eukprot:1161451-Pelagomonas_calceolata.AAC.4
MIVCVLECLNVVLLPLPSIIPLTMLQSCTLSLMMAAEKRGPAAQYYAAVPVVPSIQLPWWPTGSGTAVLTAPHCVYSSYREANFAFYTLAEFKRQPLIQLP